MNLSDTDKGWVAGIIDGEGSIQFRRPRKQYPREDGRKSNAGDSIHVLVKNSDPRMVMKLRGLVGGKIHRSSGGKTTRKAVWVWEVSTTLSTILLRQIEPYLVSKREQAILALEFIDGRPSRHHGRDGRMSEEEEGRRESIREAMGAWRSLNWEKIPPIDVLTG